MFASNIPLMPGKKPKDPLSRDEVLDSAAKLRHFAKRYEDLADQMKATKIDTIHAGHLRAFRVALLKISGAVNEAWKGLERETLRTIEKRRGK